MPKYGVRLEFIGHKWLQVEASSIEEAQEKAMDIGVNLDPTEFRDDTEVSIYDAVMDSEE
jgi:hypothetical protein